MPFPVYLNKSYSHENIDFYGLIFGQNHVLPKLYCSFEIMDFGLEDDVFFLLSPELQLPSQLWLQGTKHTRAEMRQSQDQSSLAGSKRMN